MSYKILVIEDDEDISRLLEVNLRDAGHEVTLASDGEMGLKEALNGTHELIILDLLLPGIDGFEICKRLRAENNYTPILMLSSKSSELDRVLGLELGADDYLTKPFSVREMLARVKAIFRRMEALKSTMKSEDPKKISIGSLEIDQDKHNLMVDGKPVYLTAREFELLVHFARNPGRVYTRSELLNLVWGPGYEGYEHTVNSHINRLRSKIEVETAQPRYIITVWGVGYKFSDERLNLKSDV